MLSDEKRTALIQMCHDAGVMVLLDSKFGRSEYTSVQSSWPALEKFATAVAEAAVKDAGVGEPFGYFRAEPFGWTDCKSTDDGARPLYERPQSSAAVPEEWVEVVRDLMDVVFCHTGRKGFVCKRAESLLAAASLPEVKS